jgi:D-alanine--poly(phosphoribitol) ligase subunit 1
MEFVTSFATLFYRNTLDNPDQTALVIDGIEYKYGDLSKKVQQLAGYLKANNIKRLGILASRSLDAYLGVLAAHWIGAAFVPLNPAYPVLRLQSIINRAQLDAIIIDEARLTLQESLEQSLPFIAPHQQQPGESVSVPVKPAAHELAYIMFTSGSTGDPKGVPITFGNLGYFVNVIENRYPVANTDKVGQFSNLSFDACILEMGLAWSFGAALYVIPEQMLMGPASFIRGNQLNLLFIVPSVVSIMQKLNMLKPGTFPFLKYSLFAGEALSLQQASLWQQAAPNSLVENLYGPTEITVDCLSQPFTDAIKEICHRDIVPIGKPFANIHATILNEKLEFLTAGEKGELAIAGPQISQGYWQDPGLTQQKFVKLKHPEWGILTWYLTGDYCYLDEQGIFHYLCRIDNQYKILGQRVELEEIEYHLREVTKSSEVAAVITRATEAIAAEIIAVIGLLQLDVKFIQQQLKTRLPKYMLPSRIVSLESFPYNSNGKLDRKRLADLLLNHQDVIS